jgi:hypothetical protein
MLHTGVGESVTINFDHTEATFANGREIWMFAEKRDIDAGGSTRGKNGRMLRHHVDFGIDVHRDEIRLSHCPQLIPDGFSRIWQTKARQNHDSQFEYGP